MLSTIRKNFIRDDIVIAIVNLQSLFCKQDKQQTFNKTSFRMGSLCSSSGTHLEDTTNTYNTYSSNNYKNSSVNTESGPVFKSVAEIFSNDGKYHNQ